jgi:hypothetical protein
VIVRSTWPTASPREGSWLFSEGGGVTFVFVRWTWS